MNRKSRENGRRESAKPPAFIVNVPADHKGPNRRITLRDRNLSILRGPSVTEPLESAEGREN
jgi:hypothetical protein